MILYQNLAFPSGTATAVVISRLHEAKEEGMKKAKFLIGAMVAGFIFVTVSYFVPVLYNFPIAYLVGAPLVQSAGMYFMVSPALIGAGVFTGLKNCICMFGSAFLAYIVIGPIWICRGVNHAFTTDAFNMGCADGGLMGAYTEGPTVIYLQKWWLWVAIALLFSDQIVGISLQYKSIGAAFFASTAKPRVDGAATPRLGGDGGAESPRLISAPAPQPGEIVDPAPLDQQVRPAIWVTGLLVSSTFCVVVVSAYFGMRWWEVIIAIVFGFPLSVICIQCTGETDATPTGAVGKMSQLLFAAISPANPIPNLMAASIASAGATQSTDVMQSFKTGHLLKASPRAQFFGSLWGCGVGVVASLGGWYLFKGLIPACAPPACHSDAFPAQAAMVWYNAALVLSQ
jgi:uncharacterized oligopeptide transporter (OPT) family protein